MSDTTPALDEAFERMAAASFELPNGFVNHGAMACEALAVLDCADDIDSWARRFARAGGVKVEPVALAMARAATLASAMTVAMTVASAEAAAGTLAWTGTETVRPYPASSARVAQPLFIPPRRRLHRPHLPCLSLRDRHRVHTFNFRTRRRPTKIMAAVNHRRKQGF